MQRDEVRQFINDLVVKEDFDPEYVESVLASSKVQQSILDQIPLQRAGSPEDIAGCVLYLLRDATYVTGQIIPVDGGRSIGW